MARRFKAEDMTRRIQRFLKCLELPELDASDVSNYLTQQLFILRKSDDSDTSTPSQKLNMISSLGPRQVCQYQVLV